MTAALVTLLPASVRHFNAHVIACLQTVYVSTREEGFVDVVDVPEVLACMDVFVAPYINPTTETQAIAAIEAMAMALPVVHFAVGGMQVRQPALCCSMLLLRWVCRYMLSW